MNGGGGEMKQISNYHSFNKLLLSAYSGPVLESHSTDELNPDFTETPSLPGDRQIKGRLQHKVL